MNTLPEYFVIESEVNNPLWSNFIRWLNSEYAAHYDGLTHSFYGFDERHGDWSSSHISDFKCGTQLISLEHWNECVNGFVLPERWYFKTSKRSPERKVANEYIGLDKGFALDDDVVFYTYRKTWSNITPFSGTEITYEQFQKYVLTANTMGDTKQENSKKIIGYKLIKPEYTEAALKISGKSIAGDEDDLLLLDQYPDSIKAWRQAGVLDLWFEPVYESEEKTIDMGGFKLTVKDGKCFHKTEDITQYVKELVSFYNVEKTFAGYTARVEDITFSKTGCQSYNSQLKDWIKVYNELNKQVNV